MNEVSIQDLVIFKYQTLNLISCQLISDTQVIQVVITYVLVFPFLILVLRCLQKELKEKKNERSKSFQFIFEGKNFASKDQAK